MTGVLPVALGRATRVVECLLKAGKEYVAVMHVHKDADEKTIRKTLKQFVGKIMQMPPLKSAVKRQLRQKEIYYIEVLEIDGKDVLFLVGCEAGTYIRKLIFDVGKKIGGAHMAELRRTRVAAFTEESLVTLQDLADAVWYWKNEKDESRIRKCILSVESAVEHLPKIWVLDTSVDSLCHGSALKFPGIVKLNTEIERDDDVAIFTLKNELIGVGKSLASSDEIMENNKGIAVKINKVFMSPGIYLNIIRKE